MAEKKAVIVFFSILISVQAQIQRYNQPIKREGVDECKRSGQYFNASSLACTPCRNGTTVKPSGLGCMCRPGYRILLDFGVEVECAACPDRMVASSTGYNCVRCANDNFANNSCNGCNGNQAKHYICFYPSHNWCYEIVTEHDLLGNWYLSGILHEQRCQNCTAETQANAERNRCVRCTNFLPVGENNLCSCSIPMYGGFCFPIAAIDNRIPTAGSTTLYTISGTSVVSTFFKDNLIAVHTMCNKYGNSTACQVLGNLCVLTLYEYTLLIEPNSVCDFYLDVLPATSKIWPPGKPWLFYVESDKRAMAGDTIILDTTIKTQYTFDPASYLQYMVARYNLKGEYIGTSDMFSRRFQLCVDTNKRSNAAFRFGTYYRQTCTISALELWDTTKYPLEFFDLYLKIIENGVEQLLAIPINILNVKNTVSNNRATSAAQWLLVRRFFLVDNQATISGSSTNAEMVRYAKSIQIVVRLQDDTTTGLIYLPYFKIDYDTVTRTDAVNGASVDVSFEVTYTMTQTNFEKNFQIAIGTLGTLGVIYAGYRTWVWSKRSGRPAIDFPSIINFIFFVSASLSNVFFVVTFGLAFYWLIFYKRQSVVFLVHPEGQAVTDWLGLFGAAFALKCLELIHMIIMQCTVDIFLIDWERSRGAVSVDAETGKRREIPVSIWRTYFVANEWNEIQASRKINNVFQIFAVVFFLIVVGFENVTTKDPLGNVVKDSADFKAEYSMIYRYGTAVCVYLVIGIIQWIFFVFIYERFVEDKVRQFVDLCSMSNVSVFIMSNNHFGYYIHGCSVHGKADTDMREMFVMMKKEEEDIVGKRGLEPGTDQQTFMMALPKKLRQKYEHVIGQARLESVAAAARVDQGKGGRIIGTITEKQVEAYKTMNNFFTSFIDNSLRDIRYVVKDKTFLESIMDTEFLDSTEKGIFYNDNGHSFDQVLFYGNEMTLLLFEILLFCIVDLIFTNYVIAGVITYIITELVAMVRNSGGTKNLARKTLVDERFLI